MIGFFFSLSNVRFLCEFSYNGFSSAVWVDCWACWSLSARQKTSSEKEISDLYFCCKRQIHIFSIVKIKSSSVSNIMVNYDKLKFKNSQPVNCSTYPFSNHRKLEWV